MRWKFTKLDWSPFKNPIYKYTCTWNLCMHIFKQDWKQICWNISNISLFSSFFSIFSEVFLTMYYKKKTEAIRKILNQNYKYSYLQVVQMSERLLNRTSRGLNSCFQILILCYGTWARFVSQFPYLYSISY